MKKSIFIAILSISIMFSSISCSNKTEQKSDNTNKSVTTAATKTEAKDTLNVGNRSEPNSLCPQYSGGNDNARVDTSLYDTLVEWDDSTNTVKPSVATEWEWLDSTHIAMTLRDDVYFSNGEQLTAKDVAFTFEQGSKYSLSNYYSKYDAEATEIVDDQHIVIAFSAPWPSFVNVIASTHYALLSLKSFEDVNEDLSKLSREPVGSGKYTVKEWKQGTSITLERNDNYWNKEALPYFKYIKHTFLSDNATRALSLKSGDIDIAQDLAGSQVNDIDNTDGLTCIKKVQNTINPIAFNYAVPAFQDDNVREAIALVVNRNAFNQTDYGGYSKVAYSILGQGSPYYTECDVPELDVEKAKKLMEESGYNDKNRLKLSLVAPFKDTEGTLLQNMISQIYIDLEVQVTDIATYLGYLFEGDFEIVFSELDNWDPLLILDYIDSRLSYALAKGGSQYNGKNEAELHKLIDQIKVTTDEEVAAKLYAELQQFVLDNNVLIGVQSVARFDAHSKSIEGIVYDVRGWSVLTNVHPVE
ncbi:MAG: ABC transporter substrate-binding protein [Pleomorphochaeta sp.]